MIINVHIYIEREREREGEICSSVRPAVVGRPLSARPVVRPSPPVPSTSHSIRPNWPKGAKRKHLQLSASSREDNGIRKSQKRVQKYSITNIDLANIWSWCRLQACSGHRSYPTSLRWLATRTPASLRRFLCRSWYLNAQSQWENSCKSTNAQHGKRE